MNMPLNWGVAIPDQAGTGFGRKILIKTNDIFDGIHATSMQVGFGAGKVADGWSFKGADGVRQDGRGRIHRQAVKFLAVAGVLVGETKVSKELVAATCQSSSGSAALVAMRT